MNNILTLSQLITRLSKVTGTDTGTARRFLRTLFATIEETLAAGESVEIKGIGTFHRSTDPTFGAPGGVAFIPDAALAAEINSPFAMFEAVELADGVEFEEPETPAETPEPEEEPAAEPDITVEPATVEPAPAQEPTVAEPVVVVAPTVEAEPEVETEPAAETVEVHSDAATSITYKWPEEEEEAAEAEANAAETPENEPELSEDSDSETEENKGSRLWLWIIIGILAGAGIGLAAAFLATPRPDFGYAEETEVTEETTPAASETETPVIEEIEVQDAVISPEETPAAPAATVVSETAEVTAPEPQTVAPAPAKKSDSKPEPRYDTVTKSRYLATMAREYYGRGIFWVFIYEANADHLDNPDRIRPGTRVVIPDRSTFPADLNEAQRLAEKKQAEIRKKFGK